VSVSSRLGQLVWAACAIALLVAAVCTPAQAFNYREHAQITYDAGAEFCKEYRASRAEPQVTSAAADDLCADPGAGHVRLRCFSHYVAIAADHVGKSRNLRRDKKGTWLTGDGLDCGTILGAEESSAFPESTPIAARCKLHWYGKEYCSLMPGFSMTRFLQYVWLVRGNSEHFVPDSRRAWRAAEESPFNTESVSFASDAQDWFARAAFRLHFFEDSFPAGHMGDDRKAFRHDYDNAYHDTFNAAGRFVFFNDLESNAFVFGDGGLDEATVYLPLDQFRGPPDAVDKLLDDLRSTDVGKYDLSAIDFRQLATAPAVSVLRVISAEKLEKKDCYWSLACSKKSIVLLDDERGQPVPIKPCETRVPNTGALRIFECDQTRDRVTRATTAAFWNLFSPLAPSHADASALLPARYLKLVDDAENGKSTINDYTLVMRYDLKAVDIRDDLRPAREPFSDFGLVILRDRQPVSREQRSTLAITLKASAPGQSFSAGSKGLLSRSSDADMHPEAQTPVDPASPPNKWLNIEVRLNAVDDDGNVATGAEAGVSLRDAPFVSHLFGLSLRAGAGVGDLWSGVNRRNVFADAGASIDLHVAKVTLTFGMQKEFHYSNGSAGNWRQWSSWIGARVMSVDLDRKH
jgi:hypothetical protein